MHLRTPLKYRYRRQRPAFTCFRMGLWLLFPILVCGVLFIGIGIYQNAGMFQPMVNDLLLTVEGSMNQVSGQMQTAVAPPPTPTPNPQNDVISGDNAWTTGAVSEALRAYLTVIEHVPNEADIFYRVSLGMIIQGDYQQAVTYAEQAVTANPFSSDAWAIRSWAYDWTGDHGMALTSALLAREFDENNPRALAFLAEAYLGVGQVQRAYDTADRAVEMDANSPEALRARGYVTWVGLFDVPTALEDYLAAYAIAKVEQPSFASLIAVDIAQIYIRDQNIDGAIGILDEVLEQNPENSAALFWMGQVYFGSLGDPSQASEYVQRCVDATPTSIGCWYLLGRTQARTDQLTAAALSFAKAIELGSTSARHYWWAANTEIGLGNCAKALEYLRPGYEIAVADNNTELIGAFEAIMPSCNADFVPFVEPTPTPTPEDTEGAA